MELLEIEKELKGPDGAAALKKYDDVLSALDARRRSALAAGLPPGEYGRAEDLGEAVTLARKLLRLQIQS